MTEGAQIYKEIGQNSDAVIDAHVHAGFDATNIVRRRYPTTQSIVDLVRKMKTNGVDYSAVFPGPSDLFWFDARKVAYNAEWTPSLEPAEIFPYERSNWTLFNEARLFGEGCVLPFANIMPRVKEEEQVGFLRNCIDRNIVFGFKLHTLASHTHASTLKDSKFIELAGEYSLPITIHSGSDEYSEPQQVIELAKFIHRHLSSYEQLLFCSKKRSLPTSRFGLY